MKIALITTRPISLDSGADSRNFYMYKNLRKLHEVDLIYPKTFLNGKSNREISLSTRIRFLLLGRIPYVEVLKEANFDKIFLSKISKYDVIQFEELSSYFALHKHLRNVKAKLVLDTHNIDYVRFTSEIGKKNLTERLIGLLLANKLKRDEIRIAKTMDSVIVCSNIEKEYFSKYVSNRKVHIISNAVDTTRFKVNIDRKRKSHTVLFMGLLSYAPNAEGIKNYIEFVHPKVRSKIKDYKLIIIGKNPPKWLKLLYENDTSIDLKGFVEDVRPYISDAGVCICPISSGSGTRLKILEYMSMGKPIVSTVKGAEGISVKDKENILLADDNVNFAELIIKLFKKPTYSSLLGRNAKKVIDSNYSWSHNLDLLKKLYTNLKTAS